MFSTDQMVRMMNCIYEVNTSKCQSHSGSDKSNSLRRSLADLPPSMVRKDQYPGLPDELAQFNYWIQDCGRCILSIPESLLAEAETNGDLDMYEVPMPVKYVLEKGYRVYKGHIIVAAEYDQILGLNMPEEYNEW